MNIKCVWLVFCSVVGLAFFPMLSICEAGEVSVSDLHVNLNLPSADELEKPNPSADDLNTKSSDDDLNTNSAGDQVLPPPAPTTPSPSRAIVDFSNYEMAWASRQDERLEQERLNEEDIEGNIDEEPSLYSNLKTMVGTVIRYGSWEFGRLAAPIVNEARNQLRDYLPDAGVKTFETGELPSLQDASGEMTRSYLEGQLPSAPAEVAAEKAFTQGFFGDAVFTSPSSLFSGHGSVNTDNVGSLLGSASKELESSSDFGDSFETTSQETGAESSSEDDSN